MFTSGYNLFEGRDCKRTWKSKVKKLITALQSVTLTRHKSPLVNHGYYSIHVQLDAYTAFPQYILSENFSFFATAYDSLVLVAVRRI